MDDIRVLIKVFIVSMISFEKSIFSNKTSYTKPCIRSKTKSIEMKKA